MEKYKLRAQLAGHEQDVKSVQAIGDEVVASCSRDGTVRVWSLQDGGEWQGAINYHSDLFINSLCLVNFDGSQYIASAGKDKCINLTLVGSDIQEPQFMLLGHESNVCSLDSQNGTIISGSWDQKAIVWEDMQLKYVLKRHNGSVWDLKILGPDLFLTCGADAKIMLWQGDKFLREYVGHTDVVRHLLVLDDENFISCSNDGSIKYWNLASGQCYQTLQGHESFIYSLALLSNGDLVSCGEDRTVRIWRDSACIQVITFPCISIWDVSVSPNDDIVVGSSDSNLRIFTRDPARQASEELQLQFAQSVEKSLISESSMDNLNKEEIPGPEALDKSGKEGQTVMIKLPNGVIEAFQWGENQWIKIGEVVGSLGKEKKTEYEGKFYDYVFDVDVKDGAPPLKLLVNITDNPYVTAENFLERHELPASYKEEIVRFILTNAQGVTLGAAKAENPYADRPTFQVLPQTLRLQFHKLIDMKLLKTLNDKETNKLSLEEIKNLEKLFKDKNVEVLLSTWDFVNKNYQNRVFVYDFTRSIIKYLPKEVLLTHFNDFLSRGLQDQNLNIVNLSLKIYCNISHEVIDPIDLDKVLDIALDKKLNLSISTLLLNISTYKISGLKLYPKLVSLVDSETSVADSEIAYRSLIAVGNLAVLENDQNALKFLKSSQFPWQTPRFTTLYADFRNL